MTVISFIQKEIRRIVRIGQMSENRPQERTRGWAMEGESADFLDSRHRGVTLLIPGYTRYTNRFKEVELLLWTMVRESH